MCFEKKSKQTFAFFVIDHNRYFTRFGSSSKSIQGFLHTHIFVMEIFSSFFNIFSWFCVFTFSIIWMFSWFSIFDHVFIFLRFHIANKDFGIFRAFHISEFFNIFHVCENFRILRNGNIFIYLMFYILFLLSIILFFVLKLEIWPFLGTKIRTSAKQ